MHPQNTLGAVLLLGPLLVETVAGAPTQQQYGQHVECTDTIDPYCGQHNDKQSIAELVSELSARSADPLITGPVADYLYRLHTQQSQHKPRSTVEGEQANRALRSPMRHVSIGEWQREQQLRKAESQAQEVGKREEGQDVKARAADPPMGGLIGSPVARYNKYGQRIGGNPARRSVDGEEPQSQDVDKREESQEVEARSPRGTTHSNHNGCGH